jgi:hypothetical protein
MYNTDEPIPEAVARYEAFVQFWSFLLCIAGVVLICEADTCKATAPQLYKASARFAWMGFALAIACIITSLSTAIFVVLMRTGALTTSDAAPSGTLDLCRVVKVDKPSAGDQQLLAPDPSGEAQTCPICMEFFAPDKEVRLTPCKHLFHGPCLASWLNVSRCCPMCRHDFTQPVVAAPVAAASRPSRPPTAATAAAPAQPPTTTTTRQPPPRSQPSPPAQPPLQELEPPPPQVANAPSDADDLSGLSGSGSPVGSSGGDEGVTTNRASSGRRLAARAAPASSRATPHALSPSSDLGPGATSASPRSSARNSPPSRRSPPPRSPANAATVLASGTAAPASPATFRRLPSAGNNSSSSSAPLAAQPLASPPGTALWARSRSLRGGADENNRAAATARAPAGASSGEESGDSVVASDQERSLLGAGTRIGGL